MDKLKEVVDGLGLFITEVVTTNGYGYKRCVTPEELDDFTKWMDIIDDVRKGNQSNLENAALPIFDVSNSYCGEQGEENMKADIKEIMHAAGDKFDFLRLCNEAQEELDEAAFDLDQESRMNGV